ncbi:hypothetical protein ACTJKJ_20400 [Roseateles sp. 22389]
MPVRLSKQVISVEFGKSASIAPSRLANHIEVAATSWNQWRVWTGTTGGFELELVAGLDRNTWRV